ncbi:hypothetical protein BgiMline_014222, partial [Biomphalaria glabrata]
DNDDDDNGDDDDNDDDDDDNDDDDNDDDDNDDDEGHLRRPLIIYEYLGKFSTAEAAVQAFIRPLCVSSQFTSYSIPQDTPSALGAHERTSE